MIEPEPDWLGPRVFFDISIAEKVIGRVVIELRPDICPRASENFRQFCTGEYQPKGVPIGYKGTKFHRSIPGFIIQGGDCEFKNGEGNISIYGRDFDDEPSAYIFSEPGIVALANSGPNTNGCQFFINLSAVEQLDGNYVTIGRVVDGMFVIRQLEAVRLKPYTEIPVYDCVVSECGEL